MTRTEKLRAAVEAAYRIGMAEHADYLLSLNNDDLAGDMIAYDDDISSLVEGNPEEGQGYEVLRLEIAEMLPSIRLEYKP